MKRIKSYLQLNEAANDERDVYLNIKALSVKSHEQEYGALSFTVNTEDFYRMYNGTVLEIVSEILQENSDQTISEAVLEDLKIYFKINFSSLMKKSLMSKYGTSDLEEIEKLLKMKSRIEFSDVHDDIFDEFENELKTITLKWNSDCHNAISEATKPVNNDAWLDVV
jgi:hypothetical protein